MALGPDSWFLTLFEYGHHVTAWGFSMINPRNFLLFHHCTLFLHYLSKPHPVVVRILHEVELWCESVGLNLSLTRLPTVEMAVVQWPLINIIGVSCKG